MNSVAGDSDFSKRPNSSQAREIGNKVAGRPVTVQGTNYVATGVWGVNPTSSYQAGVGNGEARKDKGAVVTPKVSQNGRDHWPDTGFALFAGAVRTGQVVGQTDSRGKRPRTRAVGAQNILGTLYHALGIDSKQKLPDFSGRPMQLLDDGAPIAELVG